MFVTESHSVFLFCISLNFGFVCIIHYQILLTKKNNDIYYGFVSKNMVQIESKSGPQDFNPKQCLETMGKIDCKSLQSR